MGLLDRLRAWLRSRIGGGETVAIEGAPTYDYVCGVCGTGVDDPDAECPLCRSSDLVADGAGPASVAPADERADVTVDPGGSTDVGGSGRDRPGVDRRTGDGSTDGATAVDGAFPGVVRRHAAPSNDEAVERLRELRDDDALLERHADRWEPHAGGYRVETTAGTRIVDSREEVAALLRATDR